jgi:hypothetical protein
MDATIEKAVSALKEAFSGFTFADQAYMLDKAAGMLLEAMDECLELEYNLKDFFEHEND